MKLLEYNIIHIKKEKEEYSESQKPRNFLRTNTKYIDYLKTLFGNLSNSELNYLIDHDKCECSLCGKETKFINHHKGYKKYCASCFQQIKKKNISISHKNKKVKSICPRCLTNETINRGLCRECKDKFTCINCHDSVSFKNQSDFFKDKNMKVCKKCELEYFLISKFEKFSSVDCYQYKFCTVCNEKFKYLQGGHKHTTCKKHRKKCKICNKHFNKQGVTCSRECSKILHRQTYNEKYGTTSNLNITGNKKSHKEYWLKRGYSMLESIYNVYNFQGSQNHMFASYKEMLDYFTENKEMIEEYHINISKHVLCYNKKTLIEFLNVYIKTFELKIGQKKIKTQKTLFGNLYYIIHKNELITLRSGKEFYFYTLLKKYDLSFETNKRYKNSKQFYDFYLPEYNEYIEIAGFMKEEEYKSKMLQKQRDYGSIILENNIEMNNYIKKLVKRNYEDNKN